MRRYFEELKDFTKKGDMFLLGMCVCLALFGVVAIASATSADKFGESNFKYLAIQLVSIGLGVVVYAMVSSIDLDYLSEHRAALVIFNVLLLLLLIPFGTDNNTGNKSWLHFPGIPVNIQPAEICKMTYIVIMASVMSSHQNRISHPVSVIHMVYHLGLLVGLNMVLSGDAGVSLIFVFIFIGMAFAGGVSLVWFAIAIAGIAAISPLAWKLMGTYQQERIRVLIDPNFDKQGLGARYHSKINMMSLTGGGLTGQGLFNGNRTQGGMLFAQHTDYIFSSVGEELGFFGCVILIGAFAVLLIMGDITEAQARKLVEGRFRFWGRAEVPQDKMSSVNDLPSTAIDFIHDPSAHDSRIIISNIAEFDYNSPDVFPAMIINHLMGGDLLSNIQASLGAAPRSENTFSLSPDPLGGYMYLSARVPNLEAVRTITEKTARLQSIRRTPLDSTTLASVKQYLIGRIALSFEDREAMGSYGVAVENGTVKQDFLEDILRQINDVTAEDVMRVAQKYIKPSQFRIVIYGDARKVVPPLELAGYDVTFYDKTAQRVARPSLSQPITDSISARDVLERYFEAMGGEKKMRAVKTLRQQYDILIGDRKLQAVVLARLPFYYQQLLLFDDEVYLKTTYNGNMGYTKVENTTTALSADAVEKGRLSRSIFPLLDYEKEGFQAELDSIVPVLGHFTYRMNVTLPDGKIQNYYFSTEDYRVLRIEEVASRAVKETDENGRVTRYEPEKIASYSDYRDYKEVDGVMYPFTTEIRDESGRIIWQTTSVDPGVSIPEKVFR